MIRQAVRGDAVTAVPLILQAIGHVAFVLSGTAEGRETASILKNFFTQGGNRISYQNTLVMEEDGELVSECFTASSATLKCAWGAGTAGMFTRAPVSMTNWMKRSACAFSSSACL